MAITYHNILLLTVTYILLICLQVSLSSSTPEIINNVIGNDNSEAAEKQANEAGSETNILLGLKAVLDKVKDKIYHNSPDAKDSTISPTPTVNNDGTLRKEILPVKETYQTLHATIKGKTSHALNNWFTIVNPGWTENLVHASKETDKNIKVQSPSIAKEQQPTKKHSANRSGSSTKSSKQPRSPGKLDEKFPDLSTISKEALTVSEGIHSLPKPLLDAGDLSTAIFNATRESVPAGVSDHIVATNTSYTPEQVLILENVQIVADASTADGAKAADSGKIETYSQFAERLSAEKKNGVPEVSSVTGAKTPTLKQPKVKTKNYASQDCGAKLLSANDGAEFPGHVINRDKDEYMLNKCNSEAYVIIELCESIKTQKIDVANFELFSNVPKDVRLYGSHRYPVRDWTLIGEFQGEEGNRGVQSFAIDSDKFIKYVKLEVLSHYGTEFYCPLSLFRIYGISEFEAIDHLEDEVDDFEEEVIVTTTQAPKPSSWDLKSLVGSVLNVIKRGSISYRSHTEQDDLNSFTSSCRSLSPSFAIQADHCPAQEYLNYILACYYDEYRMLLRHDVIAATVKNRALCQRLSQSVCATPAVPDEVLYGTVCRNSYPCVMLSVKHLFALCHLTNPFVSHNATNCSNTDKLLHVSSTLATNNGSIDHKNVPGIANDSTASSTAEGSVPAETFDSATDTGRSDQANADGSNGGRNAAGHAHTGADRRDDPASNASTTQDNSSPRSNVHEELGRNRTHNNSAATPDTAGDPAAHSDAKVPSHSSVNKESIVVRLSNKIKALEENMSISSLYLEELSQTYKRQMEEMQRQFNITITALNKSSQIAFDRDLVHHTLIESLGGRLHSVNATMETMRGWHHSVLWRICGTHLLLLVVQSAVFYALYQRCLRSLAENRPRVDVLSVENGKIPGDDRTTLEPIHRSATEGILNSVNFNGFANRSREWEEPPPTSLQACLVDQPAPTRELPVVDSDSVESTTAAPLVENLCGDAPLVSSGQRDEPLPATDAKQVIPFRVDQRHRYDFNYADGDFNAPVITDYYTARSSMPDALLRSESSKFPTRSSKSIPIVPFNYEGFQSYMQYCYHQSTLSGQFDQVGLSQKPNSHLRTPSPRPGSGHSNAPAELSDQDLNSRMRSYDPSLRLTTQDLTPRVRSRSSSLALVEPAANSRMEAGATESERILNATVMRADSDLELKLQTYSSGAEDLDCEMAIPKLTAIKSQLDFEPKKPDGSRKNKKRKHKAPKHTLHSVNGHI